MKSQTQSWLEHFQLFSLYLTILLIPVQLSKFFWPDFSSVLGLRVDYLAPAVYLSDLTIATFIFSSLTVFLLKRNILKKPRPPVVSASIFVLAIFLSLIFAKSQGVALVKSLKIIEFLLFSLFLSTVSYTRIIKTVVFLLGASILWVSILVFIQFSQQSSLGLTLLGERRFSLSTPGISQVSHEGLVMLRPYATFPHPNVLSAYLALSSTFVFGHLIFLKFKRSEQWFLAVSIGLSLFALFLTFSRSGWLAGGIGVVPLFGFFLAGKIYRKITSNQKVILGFFLATVVLLGVFSLGPVFVERFLSIAAQDSHSLLLRVKLAQAAAEMFQSSPLLGVGPGNFLILLPQFWQLSETIRWLQPVHNLYLLILSEIGIFGLGAFLSVVLLPLPLILRKSKLSLQPVLILSYIQIFFLAFFDHYFWTLQQGLLLFWMFQGLFLSFAYDNKRRDEN